MIVSRYFVVLLLTTAILSAGCSSGDHFISDRKYRKQVIKDFESRKVLAQHRHDLLFGVMSLHGITMKEKEALQFLFAYMPLADLADYTGGFFLNNVRHSFMVKERLPWGKEIPEDIFRHYVLPVRVNNESLDTARWAFYPELEPRVRDLTLEQAALEVNRWCHEKVTYKATDGRTSSPLSTVKNAFGRCGEESVLTVAALRSVGIPARQVYVPRWAHSDDNHAWVEVWIDGRWNYMGACEPEPVLNRGWFTGPSKRAMLVHSRVFGNYQGDEEVVTRERDYAVINSTAIYADVAKPVVTVVDENGNVVENARVEFGLYNYAEFYPIATLTTDNKGECSLTIGKGDILLHATDGNRCTWKKSNLRTDTLIFLVLKPCIAPGQPQNWHFDVPDEVPAGVDELPEEVMNEHKRLLAREDSIRNAFVNNFPDKEAMAAFAGEINAPEDSVIKYLTMSHGNFRDVMDLLKKVSAGHPDEIYEAFRFLSHLSEKDLRDVHLETFEKALDESPPMHGYIENPHSKYNANGFETISSLIYSVIPHEYYINKRYSDEIFNRYLYNPKVDLEVLKPHRIAIHEHFSESFGKHPEPQQLFNWIRDSIAIDTTPLYSRILITPAGVHSLRAADPYSRNIYFVAACRSMGIPSRLEPATKVPQALVNNEWTDFSFDAPDDNSSTKPGYLTIENAGDNVDPLYYSRFTIARLESGTFRTLEYPWGQNLSMFRFPLELKSGNYAITSGIRQYTGDIDVVRSYFIIEPGDTSNMVFPVPKPEIKVFGEWPGFAAEVPDEGFAFLLLETTGEPSRHLLQELQNAFTADGKKMPRVLVMWNHNDIENGRELINRYKLTGKVEIMEFDERVRSWLVRLSPPPYDPYSIPLAVAVNNRREILFIAGGYQINSIQSIKDLIRVESKE